MSKKGPTKHKIKAKDPRKCVLLTKLPKCLGPTRTLIRAWYRIYRLISFCVKVSHLVEVLAWVGRKVHFLEEVIGRVDAIPSDTNVLGIVLSGLSGFYSFYGFSGFLGRLERQRHHQMPGH